MRLVSRFFACAEVYGFNRVAYHLGKAPLALRSGLHQQRNELT
jgi:hypothetical protein